MDKWHIRFLGIARNIASWSKDPSTKVGAIVAASNNRIISMGYNGFPKGINDTDKRLIDRDIKYKIIIHAERNAILFAQQNLAGTTITTWPFMPCAPCASMIIQSGITKCVAPVNNNPRWNADFELTKELFDEAGVQLYLYDYPTTLEDI